MLVDFVTFLFARIFRQLFLPEIFSLALFPRAAAGEGTGQILFSVNMYLCSPSFKIPLS